MGKIFSMPFEVIGMVVGGLQFLVSRVITDIIVLFAIGVGIYYLAEHSPRLKNEISKFFGYCKMKAIKYAMRDPDIIRMIMPKPIVKTDNKKQMRGPSSLNNLASRLMNDLMKNDKLVDNLMNIDVGQIDKMMETALKKENEQCNNEPVLHS